MMNEYPERVRLDDDDVYRWSYDRKAGQDKQIIKVIVIVMAALTALMVGVIAVAPVTEKSMNKWKAIGIMLGVIAAVTLLLALVFALLNRRRGGFYHYRFEADPEGINVLMDERDAEILRGMSGIMGMAGAASGHPVRGALSSASMAGAAGGGRVSFSSVRKAVVNPKKDYIILKSIVEEGIIYIPPEDFKKMEKFILDHLDDSVTVIDR